jgi:hypothetical protein
MAVKVTHTISVAKLVEETKSKSSMWIKPQVPVLGLALQALIKQAFGHQFKISLPSMPPSLPSFILRYHSALVSP